MVFEYSARFSRRAVTRPGSGFTSLSALANSPSRKWISPLVAAAVGCGAPLGGISPVRMRCTMRSQPSRSVSEAALL